jgi:hypothetical protein
MKGAEVALKWWGGYFIENEDVYHHVAIQAVDVNHAIARAGEIFEDHSEYCDCCGERWSLWVEEEDGTKLPEIYGTVYTECQPSSYGEYIVLHYVDGTKETYKFGGENN